VLCCRIAFQCSDERQDKTLGSQLNRCVHDKGGEACPALRCVVVVAERAGLLEGSNNIVLTNHRRGKEHQAITGDGMGGDVSDTVEREQQLLYRQGSLRSTLNVGTLDPQSTILGRGDMEIGASRYSPPKRAVMVVLSWHEVTLCRGV